MIVGVENDDRRARSVERGPSLEGLLPGCDFGPLKLGLSIVRAAGVVERGLAAGVERAKVSPVAVRTLISVRLADGGPLNLNDLAQETRVAKANVSAELMRLEAERLIRRLADPDDARRIRARITPRGRDRLAEMVAVGLASVEQTLLPLGLRGRRRLQSLIERIDRSLPSGDDASLSAERLQRMEDMYPGLDFAPFRPSLALGRVAGSVIPAAQELTERRNLTPVALHALTAVVLLRGGPLDLGAMAPRLGVNRGSISWVLRELEKRQLVDRQPDPADGRRIRAYATRRGGQLVADLVPAVAACCAEAFAALDRAEQDELRRLLSRVEQADRTSPP
jgi:DNA-binding MarR family transcriptional regulator